jgi:hypothetical protein
MRKILIFVILLLIILGCKKEDVTSPAEVSNLIALYNGTNLILTWIDPLDNDLSKIEITYEDVSCEVNNGIQMGEINNLEFGKNYTFTVKTIDKTGNKSKGIQIQYKIDYRLQFTGKFKFSSYYWEVLYNINKTWYSDTTIFIGDVSIVENCDSIIRITYTSHGQTSICNDVGIFGGYIEPYVDINGLLNYSKVFRNCYCRSIFDGKFDHLDNINIKVGLSENNGNHGQFVKGVRIK